MQISKYILTLSTALLMMVSVFSQAYKPGDKAEAFISSAWKEVTILNLVAGKKDVYDVRAVTETGKTSSVIATYQVKEENLRGYKKAESAQPTAAIAVTAKELASPVTGTYKLYAGIQHIYFG